MSSPATGGDVAAVPGGIPGRAGRIGTNLAGVADWSTEFPFVDLMRQSRDWISQGASGWGQGGPLELRADGWPARLAPGQSADRILVTDNGHTPPGTYTVLYTGTGEFRLAGRTVTATGGSGRTTVQLGAADQVVLSLIRTDAADPVRDVHVVMAGHEATFATRPFNPTFLERIKPFAALRFMDWMQTNNSTVRTWAQAPGVGDISYAGGVPVEVMVDLANTLHADPWFTMPHQADDDYVRRFMTVVAGRLDPGLRVWLEYSNETWNWGFAQRRWTTDAGRALNLGDDNVAAWRFHAVRAQQMFAVAQDVLGEHPAAGQHGKRLVRVLAGQAAWSDGPSRTIVAEGGRQADVLAVAPYFPCANLNAGDSGNKIAAVTQGGPDLLLNTLCPQDIRGEVRQAIQRSKAVAASAGLELAAYEGGQHLVGVGSAVDDAKLTQVLTAANDDQRMEGLYAEYLRQWKDLGGGLFMSFSDIGAGSKWGHWGVLRYLDQPASAAPKYRALVAAAA